MRVHNDTFGFAEGDAKNNVGRLATDAVELDQFVERVRDVPTVMFHKALTAIAYGQGFVAKKAGAANHGFKFRLRGGGEIGGTTVTAKQRRCDEIDAFIGTLCAENGRDEKLERVVVV